MDIRKPSSHALHAFDIRPGLRYANLHVHEEVILVLRAHPVTQIPWIINAVFAFFILFILNFFLPDFLTVSQIVFLNIFGFVAILSYLWFNFLGWYFNVGIITNQRVIDVDFHAVIYKEVTETLLSKVEDVTAKSGGFIASLFDFGHVFVQTAGTEANIEFFHVPRPSEVTKIINQLLP